MVHKSKAFCKLQSISATCIVLLTDLNTLSVSLKAGFSVYIPFLKPYFSVTGMLVCK